MTNGQRPSQRAVRIVKALLVLACCAAHSIFEVAAAPVTSQTEAVGYLSQFGYLPPVDPNSRTIISGKTFSKAISEFQSFAGINVTGNLDAKTAHMMNMPRCGVKDKVGVSESNDSRSYEFLGSTWDVKSLTYKIIKYPSRLNKRTVDKEIRKAFNTWSKYTDLTFMPKRGQVDIEISFVSGEHGDGAPLDGPSTQGGSTLAHAYNPGPGIGGDAHFDDSEAWTVNSANGINLLQVATHEFGHALGLDHSKVEAALMAPFYRGYEVNFMLHRDDITGIQALYGPKGGKKRPRTGNKRPRRPNGFGIYNYPDIYGRPGDFSASGHF